MTPLVKPLAAPATLLALALTLPGTTLAQANEEAPNVDCGYPLTQMEMTYCAGKEFKKADKELNEVYADAMAAMKTLDEGLEGSGLEGAANALIAAQRAWIPFRDAACASEGFMARGGSMEPMLILGCKATLTKQRIEDLKTLAEGLGN